MMHGAHIIVYSTDVDADRAFIDDVLELSHVDVSHGSLVFGLPPAEVAVHSAETGGNHELFFMCANVDTFIVEATEKGVACGEIEDLGFGRLTRMTLPGGGAIGVYEPKQG